MSLRETLFNRSKKRERNEFVGGSLTSSRIASEGILSLSGSGDRGRLFVMRFDSEWQQPGCSVMKWYNQQCKSSTKFRSIEHRRDAEGPFFHEFLLLKLTDGAICRVERTGEGSRADAIRYIGCMANDLVQWFSGPDYAAFSVKRPSERIAEVDLYQEFDILDVIAVCYSIQKITRCRAYTLQRYNCYFLCLTVLAVLTRRVAGWETKIKADEWDTSLDAMHKRWSSLSPDQVKEHGILAICSYLEPDNPRRAQFIFDILREHLGSQAEGFAQCNKAMRQALWRADWESVLRTELIDSLSDVPNLFTDTGYCSQQLKRAAETSVPDSQLAIMSSDTLLARNYYKVAAEEYARKMARTHQLCKTLQRLWHIEHPVSNSKLALAQMAGGLIATLLALKPSLVFGNTRYNRGISSQTSMRAALLKHGHVLATFYVLDGLQGSDAMKALWNEALDSVGDEPGGFRVVQVLDRLASTDVLPPSEVWPVLTDFLEDHKDWPLVLLASLAAPGLNDMLSLLTEAYPAWIWLTLSKPETDNTCMTIEEFQETYIMHRIAAHAKRVAVHQLAAEQVVITDIIEAMGEVWKGLPLGFGPVELTPSVEVVETVGSGTG
ncbi:hypothetical protein FRC09_012082 [Ceratobasidium sp. 395]|nr:hypothetical protein FRC09_012082 [Ceratobasidium sp. 395]